MYTEAVIEEHIDERSRAGSDAEQGCIEEKQYERRTSLISPEVFTKLSFERVTQLGYVNSTSGKVVANMSNSKAVRIAAKKLCTPKSRKGDCIFKTFPSEEFWKSNSENHWDLSDCGPEYMPEQGPAWCKELVGWCFPKRLKK